jgi:ubiquinone/menaquinone biosynthesis C-methylase UbiE
MESKKKNSTESKNNIINENQNKNESKKDHFDSLNPQGYAKKEYWNERFNNTDSNFDWYADWEQLEKYFKPILTEESKVLMVGCGNSKMSSQMYNSNYKNITNIDISDVVIDKMKKQFPDMKWLEMDATKMNFEDNSFDCSIDKGTLDAIMCGNDPSPPAKLIREMHRVTKTGGHYCIITHGEPETRLNYFEKFKNQKYDFDVKCETINLSFMANFINSLRNKSSDHTLKGGLKNRSEIVASVLDAFVQSYKDVPLEGVDEKMKKKVNLCLKVQAMIEKYGGDKKN